MTHVILVVPCFNEAQRLNIDTFLGFQPAAFRLQFLFVNDGSKDDTAGVLDRLAGAAPDRCSVLHLAQNQGKAEAVRRGMQAALLRKPDHVGFWDADMATPLEELPRFVEILAHHPELEMVFGSRVKLLGRTIDRQTSRHYFGRVFATLASTVLGLAIYDTQCGAKLFKASARLETLLAEPFLSRWIFDVELLARFIQSCQREGVSADARIYELPLLEWRDVRGSKVKLLDAPRSLGELLVVRRRYGL